MMLYLIFAFPTIILLDSHRHFTNILFGTNVVKLEVIYKNLFELSNLYDNLEGRKKYCGQIIISFKCLKFHLIS